MTEAQFSYTSYIHATQEQVYDALVDPSLISQYMGGTGPRSDWAIGSKILWKSDPAGEFEDRDQEVLIANRPQELKYTWHRYSPDQRNLFDSDEAFQAGLKEHTVVTFMVEKAEVEEMGTKLTLTHTGFDSPDSPMLHGVTMGWTMIVSELKSVVERSVA